MQKIVLGIGKLKKDMKVFLLDGKKHLQQKNVSNEQRNLKLETVSLMK